MCHLHFSFYQKYATRISVCVIAVSKSQEFLLKVRRLSLFFSTTTQEIRLRQRVDVFSTTSDTSQSPAMQTQSTGGNGRLPCTGRQRAGSSWPASTPTNNIARELTWIPSHMGMMTLPERSSTIMSLPNADDDKFTRATYYTPWLSPHAGQRGIPHEPPLPSTNRRVVKRVVDDSDVQWKLTNLCQRPDLAHLPVTSPWMTQELLFA